MKKIVLILSVFIFTSCQKVYTCHCESVTSNGTATNTSTMQTSKKDANETCQQKAISEGWQTCEVAEAN